MFDAGTPATSTGILILVLSSDLFLAGGAGAIIFRIKPSMTVPVSPEGTIFCNGRFFVG
jgi:hypothetical protein